MKNTETAETAFVTKWDDLAKELGVSRRAIQDWRNNYPDDYPRPVGDRHSVPKWRQFVTEFNLGKGNVEPPSTPSGICFTYAQHRAVLDDAFILARQALEGDQITAEEYTRMGDGFVDHLATLVKLWNVRTSDVAEWREVWEDIKSKLPDR